MKWVGEAWMVLFWLRIGTGGGEPSGSTKCGKAW